MLRGGSWRNNRNNARCAYRNLNNPNNRNNNNGLRVMVSHIFYHLLSLAKGPAGNVTGWRVSLALALANAWPRHKKWRGLSVFWEQGTVSTGETSLERLAGALIW